MSVEAGEELLGRVGDKAPSVRDASRPLVPVPNSV